MFMPYSTGEKEMQLSLLYRIAMDTQKLFLLQMTQRAAADLQENFSCYICFVATDWKGSLGPTEGHSTHLKYSKLLNTIFSPSSCGSKIWVVTRLGIWLLGVCCQGETIIAITMLNESDGDGDQLLN